jgi:drug/metabolite transporter (DMT)-like permease
MLRLGVPLVFVLIWSTGFIVAKAVLPHADLQFFLIARFSLTAIVMGRAALILGAPWPGARRAAPHVLAGALMQGIYLCASYWAITHGMAAGVMALLGALQPLFTALFSVSFMGKTLQTRSWLGLFIGFAGVGLVLAPKLITHGAGSLTLLPVAAALVSVLAVTTGTIVQKWLATTDLRAAASIQSFGAALVAVLGALILGTPRWDGSAVALGCSRVVSLGAIHGWHDLAHVDDAAWGRDQGHGAAVAGAAARGGAGIPVLWRDVGAAAVHRIRACAGGRADDSISADRAHSYRRVKTAYTRIRVRWLACVPLGQQHG